MEDRRIDHVTIFMGEQGGRYPYGNSVLVAGSAGNLLIDPCLSLIPRSHYLPRVDRVANSHCHEDHISGNYLFPDAPWCLHELDLPGIRSLDDMMAIYGYGEPFDSEFRPILVEQFHFTPRPDALAFRDGEVFDLGDARVRVIHAPGHTRGHCVFAIEPDGIVYLADIELSSFGPYYGDAWASLEEFEQTLDLLRHLDARWYATFHHIGVIAGRATFLERLERFAAVIRHRERRLLDFLTAPRTLDEVAEHRFVYRPQDPVPQAFAHAVERRSMWLHVERLLRTGEVEEVDSGRYRARPA